MPAHFIGVTRYASRMKPGTLLVVATPIGNLEDLSPRGRRAFEEADLIVAEDTRRTGRLLEAHGLDRPLTSCHKFSEASRLEPLLEALSEGRTLALVTDGGTPAVSDPGRRLVAAALEAGARVVAVAGPSAVTAALSISGFPADRFLFAGFLPSKTTERRKEAAQLAAFAGTIVLFEAPHRLLDCLADLELVLGERPAALCREMTKRAGPLGGRAAPADRHHGSGSLRRGPGCCGRVRASARARGRRRAQGAEAGRTRAGPAPGGGQAPRGPIALTNRGRPKRSSSTCTSSKEAPANHSTA
jgi:16S rRNA (cytidine1402-2'-O)-methyltransferase